MTICLPNHIMYDNIYVIISFVPNSPTPPKPSGGRRHLRGLLSLSGSYVVFIFCFQIYVQFYVVARGRKFAICFATTIRHL